MTTQKIFVLHSSISRNITIQNGIDEKTVFLNTADFLTISPFIQPIVSLLFLRHSPTNKNLSISVEEDAEEAPNFNDYWDLDEKKEEEPKKKVVEVPEALRKTREYLAMIMAHEKTR